MNNPKCCGVESRLVIQSTNLQYLFCDTCKNEVKPFEFTPPDNYDELLTAFEAMLTPTNNPQPWNSSTNCSSCGARQGNCTPWCGANLPASKPLAGTSGALEEGDIDESVQLELFDDDSEAYFKRIQDYVNEGMAISLKRILEKYGE